MDLNYYMKKKEQIEAILLLQQIPKKYVKFLGLFK